MREIFEKYVAHLQAKESEKEHMREEEKVIEAMLIYIYHSLTLFSILHEVAENMALSLTAKF